MEVGCGGKEDGIKEEEGKLDEKLRRGGQGGETMAMTMRRTKRKVRQRRWKSCEKRQLWMT